jgi:hypothetical protein
MLLSFWCEVVVPGPEPFDVLHVLDPNPKDE